MPDLELGILNIITSGLMQMARGRSFVLRPNSECRAPGDA